MRVLFFSAIYQNGHISYDQSLISNLGKVADVFLLCPPNWYPNLDSLGCKEVFLKGATPHESRFKRTAHWIASIKNYFEAAKQAKENMVDCVVAAEFETFTLGFLFSFLFRGKKIILVHHNNIDQLFNSKIKKYLFSMFKNQAYHVVLEPFIEKVLYAELGVKKERVFTWPAPIEDPTIQASNSCKNYDCVGISNSNDETFIKELIEFERKTYRLEKSALKVVLRSKKYSYESDGLKVINGFLERQTYQHYIQSAKTILVAFPQSYVYRISGTIIDAFRDQTPVIGGPLYILQNYQVQYPNIVHTVSELLPEEFVSCLENTVKSNNHIEAERDYYMFASMHSDKIIQAQLKDTFSKILQKN